MIDVSKIDELVMPYGRVVKIEADGGTILQFPHYVSLGDSIAAGHTIDDRWETDYGTGSQYGSNGNTETTIVPKCYTSLIQNGMRGHCTKSFAKSGDMVANLMSKLDDEPVRRALSIATQVTVCIGANDVLQAAWPHLEEYLLVGSLASAEVEVENNLVNLATDSHPTSYISLFNKLNSINPNTKYVFTTVYNPYKYLHLDEDRNGFFGPLLATIPEMNLDIDKMIEDMFLGGTDLSYYDITQFKWVSIELELDLDGLIKDGLLSTPIVQQVFDRANNLGAWTEKYIEGSGDFKGLNRVLREAIGRYQQDHPKFVLAETKALFDTYPDRPETGDVHYNDLVNVEYTRGYDTQQMDWGALWRDEYGDNVAGYWWDLAYKYLSFSNAMPSLNVSDYVSFDMNGFAEDLVNQIVYKVIGPDVDPHPEVEGHKVLKESFSKVL